VLTIIEGKGMTGSSNPVCFKRTEIDIITVVPVFLLNGIEEVVFSQGKIGIINKR